MYRTKATTASASSDEKSITHKRRLLFDLDNSLPQETSTEILDKMIPLLTLVNTTDDLAKNCDQEVKDALVRFVFFDTVQLILCRDLPHA